MSFGFAGRVFAGAARSTAGSQILQQLLWLAECLHIGTGSVFGNGISDLWVFDPPPSHEPPPKVHAFLRTAQSAHQTTEKREIQDEYGISSLQPDAKLVVLAEVAIHYPALLFCELSLNFSPPLALKWN